MKNVTDALRIQIDTLVAELISEKWEKKQLEHQVHNLREIIKHLNGRGIFDYLFGSKKWHT